MADTLPTSTITKIDAAKEAAHELINTYGDKIALMVYEDCDGLGDPFSGDIRIWMNFTTDKYALNNAIDEIEPSMGTPIADAIKEGIIYLKNKYISNALIVVITDGEETCDGDVASAIENAVNAGYEVRVIGFGLEGDEESSLKEEVEEGGGAYYSAKDPNALKTKLKEASGEGECCCATALILLVAGLGIATSHLQK